MEQTSSPLRVAFMGSPDFAVPTLQALLDRGHTVVCVYSQPPKPAGRGGKLRKTPVHQAAEAAGIEVRTPTSLKTPEALADFQALNLDAAVVAAYGLILPQSILDAPRFGCLNVHASLLPRWRGAAPIHRAVLAGDAKSGVTIMQMVAALDAGPMLLTEEVTITPRMTSADLHDRLAELGGPALIHALEGVVAGTVTPVEQDDAQVTYAAKLSKEEAPLDWTKTAQGLDRQIRAFTPWPGATLTVNDEVVKVLDAAPEPGSGQPGEVLDDGLLVACGNGALRLKKLQRPGKKAMAAEDMLRGWPVPKGTILT
ncbi:methionyl-tRNA formyltransferase [Hwanghaeella grinnelliae]|uniref:Methionyl-tRNA formyltransferase n=1 Tax=Hwanghaeella grinnelliae TaxID=2500179 RepID=A0A437QPY0_9PROT|nr:methionyl-tRNA formyltransferase [Hwanghaeella grinnelliae]RVU36578.1 methionyl-tRNA formyltransferase [Hwanghaeella grinnelliae]